LLHDRTADAIAQALSVLPHSNVTIVPYHLGSRAGVSAAPTTNGRRRVRANGSKTDGSAVATVIDDGGAWLPTDRTPIAEVAYRQRALVAGRVHTMRFQPHGGVAGLECTIVDETGGIVLVFLGRRSIGGIRIGTRVVAEGTVVSDARGRLAILNPDYRLLPDDTT
jgi:hypothetical protein